jgi:phosphopantothenoylcysteine decarboxylase/phosphopantothenate--cysteine ligase
MSRILLGVSGGIAAYKALEFIREATARGHAVRVLQTPTSRRFVGEASFAALTGAPVLVSEFERDPARGAFPDQQPPPHEPLSHLELVANADLYLIAPASANTIAKLAAGLADNLLTSAALAASCPLVIAPAMNARMYEHPATQANLDTLRARGASIVEPGAGRLASLGEQGVGRLAEPARLLEVCEQLLSSSHVRALESAGVLEPADDHNHARPTPAEPARSLLDGLRVLVTAGGTREPIDSVRFIGNRSSGRMGLALAQAARERGAEVVLLSANVALAAPDGVTRIDVASAQQLQSACVHEFPACDVLLMAAAVADFAPAAASAGKIKKAGRALLELALAPTPDILAGLAASRREDQTLVGFAAEHGADGLADAAAKLSAKRLDALVLNDISRADIGFDSDSNEITILHASRDGSHLQQRHVARTSKLLAARAILDTVEELRTST